MRQPITRHTIDEQNVDLTGHSISIPYLVQRGLAEYTGIPGTSAIPLPLLQEAHIAAETTLDVGRLSKLCINLLRLVKSRPASPVLARAARTAENAASK